MTIILDYWLAFLRAAWAPIFHRGVFPNSAVTRSPPRGGSGVDALRTMTAPVSRRVDSIIPEDASDWEPDEGVVVQFRRNGGL